jgi:hypothetical protein
MRTLPFLATVSLVGLVGCVAQVDADLDADDDGLNDGDEILAGSDPQLPDSDEDGWLDGQEIDGFTDPADPERHPYEGGWPIGSCAPGMGEGEGWAEGDIAMDVALLDQFGETVHLHDFCDRAVFIVFAAFW